MENNTYLMDRFISVLNGDVSKFDMDEKHELGSRLRTALNMIIDAMDDEDFPGLVAMLTLSDLEYEADKDTWETCIRQELSMLFSLVIYWLNE